MGADNSSGDSIWIWGASQNNLKNVDVMIPGDGLTVVTGVSGSGKSSLAFDTLYAEGQRRYVESLSAYARQFLERIRKPQVREIRGIRPAIAIRQKSSSRNPRSTVGTVTEIYDYLRLLYARVGRIQCRQCGRRVKRDTVDEVVESLVGHQGRRCYLAFPFSGSHLDLNSGEPPKPVPLEAVLENLARQGFHRLLETSDPPRIDQVAVDPPTDLEELAQRYVLVDRLVLDPEIRERLSDSLETCFTEGHGVAEVFLLPHPKKSKQTASTTKRLRFTEGFECQYCRISYRAPEPALFSFNNPYGACPVCQGFGNTITIDPDLVIPDPDKTIDEGPIDPFTKPRYVRFQVKLEDYVTGQGFDLDTRYGDLPESVRRKIWTGDKGFSGVRGFFGYLERKKYKMHVRIFISRYRGYTRCPECNGQRLCQEARDVFLGGQRISQLTRFPIGQLARFFEDLEMGESDTQIAGKLLEEVQQRLGFLLRVGLEYLALDRLTSTLSGGEMQRIHLAASLGSALVGTLYVLDEPSIGLHPRDEQRLIAILKSLRDLGNTIVVVEHEKEMIEAADQVIDMGPGAGENGGEVVHSGDLKSLRQSPQSLTGKYLTGELRIPIPVFRRSPNGNSLRIEGARQHNLKDIHVEIPLGMFVCVTGVSGSGKSTLIHKIVYAGIKKLRGEWKEDVGDFDRIEGYELLGDVIMVDQNPIGKTPRSNPVTYLKAFDEIRQLFASLRESQASNFTAGSFSFNIPGGRCETCQGAGTVTVEMQFLADVELICEDCGGTRFQKRLLEIRYRGKNIAEVLSLTVGEAIRFFERRGALQRKLRVLQEVGLGYLRLGQSATTLSGGEAQRIKLASYLLRTSSKRPLFLFDEPTTGLHFDDIGKLLKAFDRLTSTGASVIVIEHNLDIIKAADWIIDLGPEGGEKGGQLVAQGTPEQVAKNKNSYTGKFLQEVLLEAD